MPESLPAPSAIYSQSSPALTHILILWLAQPKVLTSGLQKAPALPLMGRYVLRGSAGLGSNCYLTHHQSAS